LHDDVVVVFSFLVKNGYTVPLLWVKVKRESACTQKVFWVLSNIASNLDYQIEDCCAVVAPFSIGDDEMMRDTKLKNTSTQHNDLFFCSSPFATSIFELLNSNIKGLKIQISNSEDRRRSCSNFFVRSFASCIVVAAQTHDHHDAMDGGIKNEKAHNRRTIIQPLKH
jgi:hypothetical protein